MGLPGHKGPGDQLSDPPGARQMDPVIIHYNSTGLTDPRSPYTLSSGLSWCCDKNLQRPLLNQSQSPDEVQPPEGVSP
ncbi:hypothetical protein E5288_WYG001093 [Bos mutus]|uniref:Uncharacterized protein n=1 Tax=Bos mutus TaxID=72004 RepID=A0A6B0RR22_9CETA|nr:hypothetical protein [Bos mutus]